MYDYITRREAQVFWGVVYNVIRSGQFSEEQAIELLDPEGEKRAKYLRPKGFPRCFD